MNMSYLDKLFCVTVKTSRKINRKKKFCVATKSLLLYQIFKCFVCENGRGFFGPVFCVPLQYIMTIKIINEKLVNTTFLLSSQNEVFFSIVTHINT